MEYGLEVVVLPVSEEVFHHVTGVFHHAGTTARVAGPAPEHASYGSFVSPACRAGDGRPEA